MNTQDTERRRAALERVQRLARWADSGLRVPGTQLRFGLEALIGLVPVVGDFAGLLLSLWLLHEARRAGAPRPLLWRMLGNSLLDAGAGALPVVGDLFDFFFKANTRNAELLREYLDPQPAAAPRVARRSLFWPGLVLSAAALLFWWWLESHR